MPSLRKRVSSYFRQLSFHNEPRKRHNINENTFVTKYLQGYIKVKEGPQIIYGKNPTDLPNYELSEYTNGTNTVIGCYSGPKGGLTTVKRTEKHLSVLDDDIDYIDTPDDDTDMQLNLPKKSPNKMCPGQPIDNTTMIIKVAGNEYCVTNRPKRHSKSHSLGSIKDFNIEIEKTKIDKSFYSNNNSDSVECKNNLTCNESQKNCDVKKCEVKSKDIKINEENKIKKDAYRDRSVQKKPVIRSITSTNRDVKLTEKAKDSYNLSKSKSESNPFQHKKRGKIIQIERPIIRGDDVSNSENVFQSDDTLLPQEWNRKSEYVYGISDSLYDRNQVTKNKNGDPIADCFGIIARNDSAILAVADGVNWGEKASIAAKSAVHGSLHYLNKTIFNDTKPFENLTIKTDESSTSNTVLDEKVNLISSTREVFVCLLRAFNCAHDLILENKGMLTTLTVAVVLPLKQKLDKRVPSGEERTETDIQYVCCVCNVGDTLAYIYSKKYGVRELTKGSHDINCNRDMRDALGALGPVDGINPELSNLTLSITTLQKGDIIMVASDGLTDNFDPNVCKFTVNTKNDQQHARKSSLKFKAMQPEVPVEIKSSVVKPARNLETSGPKPPIKPPRKSKTRDLSARNSAERGSINSNNVSDKSSSPSVENVSMQIKNSIVVQHSEGNSSIQPEMSESTKSTIKETKNNDAEAKINENVGSNSSTEPEYENPLIAAFMSQNSLDETPKSEKSSKQPTVVENRASSLRRQTSSHNRRDTTVECSQKPVTNKSTNSKTVKPVEEKNNTSGKIEAGYKFLRSKTTIDMRSPNIKPIVRNEDGIPYITPIQRYDLQLLLMEDILKNGISGKDAPCTSAKQLCENLINYTLSITSAKRHTLEDQDLYFDNKNGVLVEVTNQEKKIRRKKGLERVQNLPGKLDHVTVVAFNVGNHCNN